MCTHLVPRTLGSAHTQDLKPCYGESCLRLLTAAGSTLSSLFHSGNDRTQAERIERLPRADHRSCLTCPFSREESTFKRYLLSRTQTVPHAIAMVSRYPISQKRSVRESNSIFVPTKNACCRNNYQPYPSVIAEGIEPSISCVSCRRLSRWTTRSYGKVVETGVEPAKSLGSRPSRFSGLRTRPI